MRNQKHKAINTWKLPWLTSIEINLDDVEAAKASIEDLGGQVEGYELLISGMEPKARRQPLLAKILAKQVPYHFPHVMHQVLASLRKKEQTGAKQREFVASCYAGGKGKWKGERCL